MLNMLKRWVEESFLGIVFVFSRSCDLQDQKHFEWNQVSIPQAIEPFIDVS